jgi:hypothetical protein
MCEGVQRDRLQGSPAMVTRAARAVNRSKVVLSV